MQIVQSIIYFTIAIFATTAGAIAGIGGGVVIRPLLDILGDFNTHTISVLSSLTVLSMAFVSVGRHIVKRTVINVKIIVPLATGAAIGGIAGQWLLAAIVTALSAGAVVTAVQNALLLSLTIVVFVFMKKRDRIRSKNLSGTVPIVITGMFLGVVSTFIGIGGGPLNVALIIYMFSVDLKTATVGSIVTILFSQLFNAIFIALNNGFSHFNLTMLPSMIVGAVLGGFIGTFVNRKFSEKSIARCFNVMQTVVFLFAMYNILRSLGILNALP